ncbi:MAG: aryl-sulfate sulfotransferase [Thermoplasmata archaeon]|nr:aryl-sulfate sulfotransferase [Thermoplasmata archaeon]
MMVVRQILVVVILLMSFLALVTPTNGIIKMQNIAKPINDSINTEPCVGYTILDLLDGNMTLIDMDGNVIHVWKNISMWGKMFPGGTAIGPSTPREGYIMGREFKKVIQEEWNGSVTWSFSNWSDDHTGEMMARAHHDIQRVGNPVYYAPGKDFVYKGNTLILARKNLTNKTICPQEIVDDVIYEVDWNGNLTGFKWFATEHFNELGFNIREKIGIYLFPGYLFGMTKKLQNLFFIKHDWLHINTVAILGENHWFNEGDTRFDPDNIMIVSRHANIIAIISKETGKIVWKIGPHYDLSTEEGRKIGRIIGPHSAHMIPEGLPGAGNILIFDNGGLSGYGLFGMPNQRRPYSRVIEINPVTLDIVWEYKHPLGFKFIPSGKMHKFLSATMGNAQRLPNGNTLICEGRSKRVFEVNSKGEIVWELTWHCRIYRAYRVPPEWVPGNPCRYTPWENTVMINRLLNN